MIRKAIVLAIKLAVIALAAYAFFFLPLGNLTPWKHIQAILSTEPAHQTARDIVSATKQIEITIKDSFRHRFENRWQNRSNASDNTPQNDPQIPSTHSKSK